ncbi:MAG TPA: NAD-dependent epimerase/dehydratase family protein [Opitutaceae bacterium]|nr:NAD-dependent epimerase/dehydratase family protein [Opitutaceae bacterium]
MSAVAEGNFSGKQLVIFGCGYVGSAVAMEGMARGLRVTALTRNASRAVLLRREGVAVVEADLATGDWHERVAAAPEFALNCVSSGGGGLESYRRSYVEGMASIAAWAERRGAVHTFVYTSSTSVYPQGDGARVDEEAATAGAGGRGQVLLEAERRAREAGGAWTRWFILRLAGIYGPGRHHLLEQVGAGEVAGVGEHRLNVAHRDDITAAIWSCFGAPPAVANEIFNVADDAPAPKAEVTAWLAGQLGRPAPRFTGLPLGGRRSTTPDRVIGNAKLKDTLGWRPRFPTYRDGYKSLLSR